MTEVEESGHHDLCFLSDPCSQEVPDHGFCSRQSTFCIHCERECICERLKQAENYARIAVMHTVDVDSYEQGQSDALDAAVQRVKALAGPTQWRPEPRKTAQISEVIAAIKGES